ncbi:MAG: hypothetical protein JRN15_14540 [Nitrososphaerota archaeon]|nr:hypothetical protein [Nitrososphaerota archaeon]
MDSSQPKPAVSAKPAQHGAVSEESVAVLKELDRILESRYFRHCTRGKQFLNYVVREKLEGRSENLKERSIGVAVFRRAATYATGDDPVVRVQAGDVRRRLDQYYQECSDQAEVRIELPIGSYIPEFRQEPASPSLAVPPNHISHRALHAPTSVNGPAGGSARWWRAAFFILVAIVIAVSVAAAFIEMSHSGRVVNQGLPLAQTIDPNSVLGKFWAPVLSTSQPVMIYLAKGVTYRPSPEIYEEYARTHHGAFAMQVQRANEPLPLNPDTKLLWKQMSLYTDFGVAAGDVDDAVRLSTLFGRIGKPDQVRIGSNFSYADLSNSPTVLIGGFDDEWTMNLMSKLHFAFVDDGDSHLAIQEQIPHGRRWPWPKVEKLHKDYAVVTRLVNSATGQFTVIVAGCSGSGTEAAGEFVTNDEILAEGVQSLPAGWQNRNLQLVLETHVADGTPEPAKVIASYSW